MSVLTQAVDFAMSAFHDRLPGDAIKAGVRALVDYFGVTLAGSKETVSRAVQGYVRWLSTPAESKLFGTGMSAARSFAALANGVAGHALDYDDVSWTTVGHPTVTVAPAALAAGEVAHALGADVLKAYVIGVEVENKIATLVMPGVLDCGWHTTAVFGPFGAAVAVALLSGLEREQFVSALGIAASKSSGVRSNFGTMTKPYHAGMAAFNGTTAAILASLGITGAENAIEAEDGFARAFSGDITPLNRALNFGSPWDIVSPGLVLKKYPCCSGAHPALDCLFSLMRETPFAAAQVESIDVGVSLLGPRELVCHRPSTPVEARFSMEYSLAAAIVYGSVGLDQYSKEAVNDRRISALLPRIHMAVDPELASLGLIGTAPVKLKIKLNDGRLLECRCDLAIGNPEKPLTDAELRNKFVECASTIYEAGRCQQILAAVFSLEEVREINTLTSLL